MMSTTAFFSVNPDKLAHFYESVLIGKLSTNDDVSTIKGEDFEVLILKVPEDIAKEIVILSPPEAREEVAIKPVFTVPALREALQSVVEAGGVVTTREFTYNEFDHADVLDTEGNVIQLKSRSLAKD